MKKNDFKVGEIYDYCQCNYCYLGLSSYNGRNLKKNCLLFCLEDDPKRIVAFGSETFKYFTYANKKYLTAPKLLNGKIYVTKNNIEIIGNNNIEYDFYGVEINGKNKPFAFKLANGNGTINLNHKDIRKLKLKK